MCFPGSANWKREVVPDHKFDFVDVQDYHNRSLGTRLSYSWLYVLLLKSFLVYLSDLFTAITLLSTNGYSTGIDQQCQAQADAVGNQNKVDCVVVNFQVAKWIFFGCILLSYVLLAYEALKAQKIIRSRDISYAFTNVMANNYYSFRSYDHFCFFNEIENTTEKKDDFAFFIFFTFKGWKRLLLADGPRQVLNILTLYSFLLVNDSDFSKFWNYYEVAGLLIQALIASMAFTVSIFLGSILILIIAAIGYVPLLCYIQGNLKEYCCHRVDKRISELMKRKNRQRAKKQAQIERREAQGDFSHLKNKRGELVRNPVPQATLPQIALDDDVPHHKPTKDESYPASIVSAGGVAGAGNYPDFPPSLHGAAPDYPPPMPLYEQAAFGHEPPYLGAEYDDSLYDHEHRSTDGHKPAYGGPSARSTDHLTEQSPHIGLGDDGKDYLAHLRGSSGQEDSRHNAPSRADHPSFTADPPRDNRKSSYSFDLDYYDADDPHEDSVSPLPTGVSPMHTTHVHKRSTSGAYQGEDIALQDRRLRGDLHDSHWKNGGQFR